MKNKFGLSRDIPEGIKRAVRQRCGYGCVLCGSAIYQYEHIEPDFYEAREHNPDGITLLCGSCHDKKTRKFLSAARVLKGAKAPAAKAKGFAFTELESGDEHPVVRLGGFTMRNCRTPLELHNVPMLRLERGEAEGAPFQLTASFFDSENRPTVCIYRNELFAFADNWDVEAAGGRIVVRTAAREIALQLHFQQGGGITVERLDMAYGAYRLRADPDKLEVLNRDGRGLTIREGLADNCLVGLSLN